ncbi:hypothetical protein DPMN_017715 [Dreissena polymorpha]|uniref:Uncharacterized protein n=1 Tax=Dreissena polymorpha TaxID=45954 RepID=A0A9D4S8F9_DREPO|nr:hypothetical protein DPMN_017715 [Dreissena polymorpha]
MADGDFPVCACGPEPEAGVQIAPTVLEPSSWGFTCADLIEAQGHDLDLSFALQWLTKGVEPGDAELFSSGPEAKYYWLNKEQLVIIDAIIYQNNPVTGEKQLVMPNSMREEAIRCITTFRHRVTRVLKELRKKSNRSSPGMV